MAAQVEPFGTTADGTVVHRVRLEDGLRAAILTYGGIVAELQVPGRDGRHGNVVLGLPDLAAYEARSPNFGATVGRYAGRIAGARFELDGADVALTANEGRNCLHGGARGFAKRVWTLLDADARSATLEYRSADGEEGFPGALRAEVTFTVAGGTLRLDYAAETDRPTVINLTNHSYFNLRGEGEGDVLGHVLQVDADEIIEVDGEGIPTGRRLPVEGTPFDFRSAQAVGARIRTAHPQIVAGLGYDCCFILRGEGLRTVARVADPASGRVMTVRTDQPGLQLYTANKLTGALAGLSGRTYRSGDGLCLEAQHFPDSPHHPDWPSVVLRPGERFRSTTEYAFATRALGERETLG